LDESKGYTIYTIPNNMNRRRSGARLKSSVEQKAGLFK
jgi:hypothetical protein